RRGWRDMWIGSCILMVTTESAHRNFLHGWISVDRRRTLRPQSAPGTEAGAVGKAGPSCAREEVRFRVGFVDCDWMRGPADTSVGPLEPGLVAPAVRAIHQTGGA